jgi:S-adenosylmethionine/arginine decarboxylase-like enzyme
MSSIAAEDRDDTAGRTPAAAGTTPGGGTVRSGAGVRPIVLDHYVGEVVGVSAESLGSTEWIQALAAGLADRCHLTVVDRHTRTFSPGVTCLFVLSQSHLALHTWPEHCYLHLDLVACSRLDSVDIALADALAAVGCGDVVQSLRRVEYAQPHRVRPR